MPDVVEKRIDLPDFREVANDGHWHSTNMIGCLQLRQQEGILREVFGTEIELNLRPKWVEID